MSQAKGGQKDQKTVCVCVLSDRLTELQPVSLWVDLHKTPEAWEHSEIITLSLHINSRLKEYKRLCLCVRERETEMTCVICLLQLHFSLLLTPFFLMIFIDAYLRSKKTGLKETQRGFMLLQGSDSNNRISLEFSALTPKGLLA